MADPSSKTSRVQVGIESWCDCDGSCAADRHCCTVSARDGKEHRAPELGLFHRLIYASEIYSTGWQSDRRKA